MVYVALLRGINVGGNNKIDMKLLKQTFEQAGMNDVVTYINTGNIIFRTMDGQGPNYHVFWKRQYIGTLNCKLK